MDHILSEVGTYDRVVELAPEPGSEYPEISWGDHYLYYAPDGRIPRARQPFATIVTKDYPNDADSRLDADGRWRLNIHVGRTMFIDLIGVFPEVAAGWCDVDRSRSDAFFPHPLYSAGGWISVINPGSATHERAMEALRDAYLAERRRVDRRNHDQRQGSGGR